MDLTQLMREVLVAESPDLHLKVGEPPLMRQKNGSLTALSQYEPMTKQMMEDVIGAITTPEQKTLFKEKRELDFSYHAGEISRFRVNVYEERLGPALAFRVIPEEIPTLETLGLQEIGQRMANLPNGLILITGTTGMGKSTTLASMIDSINASQDVHIITIEDPIEFVYKKKRALVTQREVNVHTRSFADAIRAALRQDPDVILVGEMRDLETMAAAITLAETGHLVFSTLHTSDAAQTVDRIIDVFPPYQQQQIRAQLSVCLKGVISQVLVPRADGNGRLAIREVMWVNDAIRNCITKGETHQIYSMIQLGGGEGMNLLDQALAQAARAGLITPDEAFSKAEDMDYLRSQLTGTYA